MKRTIFTLLVILFSKFAFSQINTFPYAEGFENPFALGVNVFFEPNFYGNEVNATNRIFQDNSTAAHSGTYSCALVPTSSFDAIIDINMDLTGVNNSFVSFWASSGVNGTGTRAALMFMSASIDGGGTFSPEVQIGDSTTFPNANTGWNSYQYALPYFTNSHPDVILRIYVTRGDGSGTTAKLLMDDFTADFSLSDITPPGVYGAHATTASQVKVGFNEPVNATSENAGNYSGLTNITNVNRTVGNDSVVITLGTPLTIGQWYTLSISGVEDASGNAMVTPQNFIVVFNNNTGNVMVTEIMYNNPGSDSLSFIEIKNQDNHDIVIGGWQFDQGLNFIFPSGMVLPVNGYAVFAEYKSLVDSFFNIQSIDYNNSSLNNSGENVSITNSTGELIDSVHYDIALPWDTMANGYGASLVLCDETSNNDDAANWTSATNARGGYNSVVIYANPMNNCALNASVNEIEKNNLLELFPNPAAGKITLRARENNFSNHLTVLIHDVTGKSIRQFNNLILPAQLDFTSLQHGIYFVTALTNDETIFHGIITIE